MMLTSDQTEHFHQTGYVVLPGLFHGPELASIIAWTEDLQAWPETPGKAMKYFEPSLSGGTRLLQRIENFYPYHDSFRNFIDGEKMRGIAGQLLGEDAVLFKEKVNFKLPGGGGFTPHQDAQAGWNQYASYHLTAAVSIDACTLGNGCLEMASGHHDRGLIGDEWKPLSDEQMQGMAFEPLVMVPGDAVFFDSYAPHRSAPNLTERPRRVLYITYNRKADGDSREQYYIDKRKSFPPDCEREPGKVYKFKV